MRKHTKIYLDFFGYDEHSFIQCEMCPAQAVDIHHIDARGMGGDPTGSKDKIENLMAVCRSCHIEYGDKKHYKELLRNTHLKLIQNKL